MALKRIDERKAPSLPACRIYLDDIVDIHAVLSELGEVEITADGYQAESVEDLAKLPARLRDLELSAGGFPSIYVHFGRHGAYLRRSGSSAEAKAAASDIREIVNRRRRRIATWLAHIGVAFSGMMIITCASIVTAPALRDTSQHAGLLVVGLALVVIGVGLITGYLIVEGRLYTIIIPRTRRDALGFWGRNKDNMVVGIITALVGGVLGVVGTLLTQALTSKK